MEEVLRKRAVAINVQSELTDAAEVKKIDAQLLYLGAQRQALPSVQRWSLEKLMANFLHLRIHKDCTLQCGAWDQDLSPEQEIYAATDAAAVIKIRTVMRALREIVAKPFPSDATSIHSKLRQMSEEIKQACHAPLADLDLDSDDDDNLPDAAEMEIRCPDCLHVFQLPTPTTKLVVTCTSCGHKIVCCPPSLHDSTAEFDDMSISELQALIRNDLIKFKATKAQQPPPAATHIKILKENLRKKQNILNFKKEVRAKLDPNTRRESGVKMEPLHIFLRYQGAMCSSVDESSKLAMASLARALFVDEETGKALLKVLRESQGNQQ